MAVVRFGARPTLGLRPSQLRNPRGSRPLAPTVLEVTGASGGTVADLTPTLTFTAGPGATSHKVQWSTDPTFATVTGEVTVAMPTVSYEHTVALDNMTDYSWRVAAINAAGQGPWSSVLTVQTEVVVFLDLFDTDDAAPIADPLATSPAGDTWDVHDTGDKLSIASSILGMSSSTATGNPLIKSQTNLKALLTAPGGCIALKWRTGGGRVIWGISNTTSAGGGESSILVPKFDLNNSGNIQTSRSIFTVPFAQDNTWYWAFLTKRTAGFEFRIYGGIYTSPFLIATISDQTTLPGAATHVIAITAVSTAADFDFDACVAAVLPAPFSTDTGAADEYQATSTADDEIAMATNAQVEWQFTAQTGVTRKLYVRYIDATHYIAIVCNQGASTLAIVKNEGSGESTLNSVSWTWTDATLYRVNAFLNGATVEASAATGAEWATTSNPIAKTIAAPENGGIIAKVSHDGGVFASWPLVRADIKAVFDKLIAATA